MKKLIIAVTAVSVLGLSACGTMMMNDMGMNNGTGNTGYVATANGKATLVGQAATAKDMAMYKKKGVVYHNGVAYHIENGRYILVR